MTSLEQNQKEAEAAEAEVSRLADQIRALKELKRAASAKVDVLARQREQLLRSDPGRRRMVIGG